MTAQTLRRAAAAIRDGKTVDSTPTECVCDPEPDHWFDRSICPEPCGSMHNICVDCGRVQGRCLVGESSRTNGNREALAWLAVADWFEATAEHVERRALHLQTQMGSAAVSAARAYLNDTEADS